MNLGFSVHFPELPSQMTTKDWLFLDESSLICAKQTQNLVRSVNFSGFMWGSEWEKFSLHFLKTRVKRKQANANLCIIL
jgi:hypothetical protein